MTAGLEDHRAPPSAPEVMSAGPRRIPRRLVRFILIGLLLLAVLIGGGIGGWRIYRVSTDLVSLAELRSTYAGFLSADGRNAVFVLHSPTGAGGQDADAPTTLPTACAPLNDATFRQQFPPAALDGVSTFQGGGFQSSVALFSYRFGDEAAAETEFARLNAAAAACDHRRLSVSEPLTAEVTVTVLPTTIPDTQGTLDFLLATTDHAAYQVTVARYKNVLSWEYSYRAGTTATTPDHNLLLALSSHLHAMDRVGG